MDKPLSLTLREAKNNIVSTINEQALPPAILLLLMKDIMTEITEVERDAYAKDMMQYKEKLQSTETAEDQNGNNTD